MTSEKLYQLMKCGSCVCLSKFEYTTKFGSNFHFQCTECRVSRSLTKDRVSMLHSTVNEPGFAIQTLKEMEVAINFNKSYARAYVDYWESRHVKVDEVFFRLSIGSSEVCDSLLPETRKGLCELVFPCTYSSCDGGIRKYIVDVGVDKELDNIAICNGCRRIKPVMDIMDVSAVKYDWAFAINRASLSEYHKFYSSPKPGMSIANLAQFLEEGLV